jgi:PadR family transcriptional regulator
MLKLSDFEKTVYQAVCDLKDQPGYGVTLRQYVNRLLGKEIGYGILYKALENLESCGMVEYYDADPTPERGNRPRRYYIPVSDED